MAQNAINLRNQGVAYFNGVDTFSGVDGSTAGKILTSNGTGVAPSFQNSTIGGGGVFQNAFHAYLSAGYAGAASPIDPVIWDAELFDDNNCYDTTTGLYTCPTEGAYLFYVGFYFVDLVAGQNGLYVYSSRSSGANSRLMINNPYVISPGSTGGVLSITAGSPFYSMAAGETIGIRFEMTDHCDIGGGGPYYSYFGGYKASTYQAGGGTIYYEEVTNATKTIVVNYEYGANRGGGVAFTLPATSPVGSKFTITGISGLWSLAQAASQYVNMGAFTTTIGVGGLLTATNARDSISCICIEADKGWNITSSMGNINEV